jgi:hypothetical protein
MPTISDPNVVRAIAREYVTNGRNKPLALITVGYKPSYANSGKGTGLYEKEVVKAAIRAKEAAVEDMSEYSIKDCDKDYKRIMEASEANKQFSTASTCVTGRARLRGWDKDNQTTTDTPTDLSPDQVQEAIRAANVVLSGNMEAKA